MGLSATSHQPVLWVARGLSGRPRYHRPFASTQYGVASFSHSCHGGSGCPCPLGAALASTTRTVGASRCLASGLRDVGMWGWPHHARTSSSWIRTSCASAFRHALRLKLECPHSGRLGCAHPRSAAAPPTLVRYDSYRFGLVMDDQTSPSFSGRQLK